MSNTLAEQAAKAKEAMGNSNPTVANANKSRAERKRIPLSVPTRKLEVPAIPGFYLRWVRGNAQRLLQAERAGFSFVSPEEVDLNNTLVGGDATTSGNTDMGGRVSIAEGGEMENGQAVRLYLMKQPMEWYLEDRKILDDRNDGIADSLNTAFDKGQVGGRAEGETNEDMQNRYVNSKLTKRPDLFRKKRS